MKTRTSQLLAIIAQEAGAMAFTYGSHLWYSHYAGKPALTRVNWQNSKETQNIPLPPMANDAVAYVAQNPITQNEIAIATFKRSVYLSKDLGQTWKQIAKDGQT